MSKTVPLYQLIGVQPMVELRQVKAKSAQDCDGCYFADKKCPRTAVEREHFGTSCTDHGGYIYEEVA